MKKVLHEILGHKSFMKTGIPLLDPCKDMGPTSDQLLKLQKQIDGLEATMAASSIRAAPELPLFLEAQGQKLELQLKTSAIERELHQTETSAIHTDLRIMRRLLQRLNFVDSAGVVQMKGRMACEITCGGSELLLTEVVFRNIFEGLDGSGVAALCSCFVLDENPDAEFPAEHRLAPSFEAMKQVSKEIAIAMSECGLQVKESDKSGLTLRPELIEGVLAWLGGSSFYEVSVICNMYEGSLVRVLRRLDDLLRELGTAAQAISNIDLAKKVQDARTKLQHGIIFAPSLYL